MSQSPLPLYERLQTTILSGDPSASEADIRDRGPLSAGQKLSIYINAYRLRLEAALEADYPETQILVGPERFHVLAERFIAEHPSTHPNLDHYTVSFAAFLCREEGVSPEGDMARLEASIAAVFIGAESNPLTSDHFAAMSASDLAQFAFRRRASSQFLALSYPVAAYMEERRTRATDVVAAVLDQSDEFVYLYRHHHEVQRVRLDKLGFDLLQSLTEARHIDHALEIYSRVHPGHAAAETLLAASLGTWIARGFFSAN